MASSIKNFAQERAERAGAQLHEYEARVAMTEEQIDSSPIEALAVKVLQAREIGWQALHVVASIPEYITNEN